MAIPKSKKVAIVQSSYLPWKGYFDLINSVDEFILYDDAQFTKRDWRDRNRIKTREGIRWLSIPVLTQGRRFQAIKDVKTASRNWPAKHWKSILHAYARARYFREYGEVFKALYLQEMPEFLSEVNYRCLHLINKLLGITTPIHLSMEYALTGTERSAKLFELCLKVGATEYVSGPAARNYLDADLFLKAGIAVSFFDYSDYPEYSQLYPPFDHHVSIIDLIFNEGPNTSRFLKSFRGRYFSAQELRTGVQREAHETKRL